MATESLTGRAAAITGASSGIGEATAVALSGAGAAVALSARRKDRIEAIAKRIEHDGGDAVVLPADIADEGQARGFVERARERLGRLDVLVNNAGVMLLGRVEGADTSDWRRMVEVNLLGLLWCTHAALPMMREQGGGHIVNVSSVAGRVAGAGSAVYNLTKFGVHGFSEGLRQEALDANVRVTTIAPGFVDTELQGHNRPRIVEAIDRRRADIGQVLRPEDVAEAIVYAVSQPEHVDVGELLVRPTRQRF
jgi:NADP-dependent 3-hydroxy acid dehydrogenase YdfG